MPLILVVDDHHLIRTGVKDLLESAGSGLNVEGVGSIAETLAFLSDHDDVDLVLMDLMLPDATAMDGLTRLKECRPATPVALISGTEDNDIISAAVANGADGFIPKSADPNVLVNAVSLILQGEIFLPRSYWKADVAEPPVVENTAETYVLTSRQADVLTLMRGGLSNKEIARQLELSESTIKTHVSAILKELGTTSRAKAIARVANMSTASELSE